MTEDPDPVIIEYKGVKWKLKAEPPLTFLIKTLLETKPGLIAEEKPEFNEEWFARESLAAVIRDCLEYNYSDYGYKGRGDCPTWRNQALWTLGTYAKGYFDDLDPQAKDPFYDIVKWMKGGKK